MIKKFFFLSVFLFLLGTVLAILKAIFIPGDVERAMLYGPDTFDTITLRVPFFSTAFFGILYSVQILKAKLKN